MKPITFFDLETTGQDPETARIVEIAIIRVENGEEKRYSTLVNPGVPIPAEATAVHGITDEMVKDYPTFIIIATAVMQMFQHSDIGGYNSNTYDIPLLYNEFARVGFDWNLDGVNFYDACVIFKRQESRTLTAAVRFYLNDDHEGAHGALADVQATINVFNAQKDYYQDLGGLNRDELALYCNYDKPRADLSGNFVVENGEYIMNFGKHKGTKAKECISYLQWMLNQDFMPDTKAIINKVIRG